MPNSNRGNTGFQSNEFEQEYDRPSKSQLKREMTALQKLGAIREGVLRQSFLRNGEYHDQVLWSIVGGDWREWMGT